MKESIGTTGIKTITIHDILHCYTILGTFLVTAIAECTVSFCYTLTSKFFLFQAHHGLLRQQTVEFGLPLQPCRLRNLIEYMATDRGYISIKAGTSYSS